MALLHSNIPPLYFPCCLLCIQEHSTTQLTHSKFLRNMYNTSPHITNTLARVIRKLHTHHRAYFLVCLHFLTGNACRKEIFIFSFFSPLSDKIIKTNVYMQTCVDEGPPFKTNSQFFLLHSMLLQLLLQDPSKHTVC